MTWTPDEVSILCPADRVPSGASVETPWRCLRVAGPVQLALTGILASIVSPLADARVNIFAFSTFDTDYVLVPAVRLSEALAALNAAGHRMTQSGTSETASAPYERPGLTSYDVLHAHWGRRACDRQPWIPAVRLHPVGR